MRVTLCITKWKTVHGAKNSEIVPLANTGLPTVQIKSFPRWIATRRPRYLCVKVDDENSSLTGDLPSFRCLWGSFFFSFFFFSFSFCFFCEQSDFILSQTPLVSLGPVLVNNFYPVIRWFFVCAMNEWMKMFVITQVLWHSGTKMPINQNSYRPAMEILACDTVAFKCSIDNIKLLLKINFCASKCYTQF